MALPEEQPGAPQDGIVLLPRLGHQRLRVTPPAGRLRRALREAVLGDRQLRLVPRTNEERPRGVPSERQVVGRRMWGEGVGECGEELSLPLGEHLFAMVEDVVACGEALPEARPGGRPPSRAGGRHEEEQQEDEREGAP